MPKSTFGGGTDIKVSQLSAGDTIRNPRNKDMIMIVEEAGNQVFVRGYEAANRKYHLFLPADLVVTKVTQAQTETTEDI